MNSGVAQALAASLRAVAGRPCVYRRGSEACEITAVVGQTTFERIADTMEIAEEFHSQDFLFPVCELELNGVRTVPESGDTIEEYDRETHRTLVFEVMTPAGSNERPWRYSDTARTLFRVHTKQVSE